MSQKRAAAQDLSLVAAANRGLAGAWQLGLLSEPPLDTAALIAKAEKSEKDSLESGEWMEALDLLASDLRGAAALNPLGRSMAHAQLVGILRQRIRARKLWSRHPAILERPIREPLIILGQMRSGTTLLHRLLACDPQFAFTRMHEGLYPMARPLVGRWQASAVGAVLHAFNPNLRAVHPTAAEEAEEEFGLHAFSLHGAMFEAQWFVPNYARWSAGRDLAPGYREFRRLLQTLQWRRGATDQRVQLLKAPQFMQDLPAVLREFPDARIVMLTRDLDEVMASTASLVWHQRRIQSDKSDRQAIGAEWREKTLLRQERASAALSNFDARRLVTVKFEELTADWARQIEIIYGHFGFALDPRTRSLMGRVAGSRNHRRHGYSAAEFGLDVNH